MADVVGDDEGWENVQAILNAMAGVTDRDELVEELLHAIKQCRSVSAMHKQEVESLTGYSFNAIADYTERAAARIQADAATIAGMIKRPISANDVKSICEDWLNADDPTHWGAFEKRLAAALKGGDHD